MDALAAAPLTELRVDGGATRQRLADAVPGRPARRAGRSRPKFTETTALGAAYLAGVGIGLWTIDQVSSGWREKHRYEPAMSADHREQLLHTWRRAVERAQAWDEA